MSRGRVDGKSVVITGAAKGIGRACAEVFAREGARLELNDVDEAGLRQAAEGLGDEVEVVTVVANVSVEEDARRIVATALGSYGALDSLVANAGIIPLSGIEEASAEEWEAVMAIDGRGMFLTCKFAIEAMGPRGRLDRLPFLDLRPRRPGPPGGLRPGQVRRLRPHQAPRCRTGAAGHPGQRGGAGDDPDRGRRRDPRRLRRADASGPPAGEVRRARRGRRGDLLPRLRRRLLHHRRDPARRRWLPGPEATSLER